MEIIFLCGCGGGVAVGKGGGWGEKSISKGWDTEDCVGHIEFERDMLHWVGNTEERMEHRGLEWDMHQWVGHHGLCGTFTVRDLGWGL